MRPSRIFVGLVGAFECRVVSLLHTDEQRYCERFGESAMLPGLFADSRGKRTKNNVLCRFSPITNRCFVDSG